MTASIHGGLAVLTAPRGGGKHEPVNSASLHVHHSGDEWKRVPLDPVSIAYPHVALLPDGETLVVDARCQRYDDGSHDDNAHVFDPDGRHRRAFCLGDGIEHVGVDASGAIWVAYFDEGVYGSPSWEQPVGASGLVRFSPYGDRLWEYQPPPGAGPIDDCYALNVDAHTTWICYYSGFPLVRVEDGRATAFTQVPVRGAKAVIVSDRDVLFVGDYKDPLRLSDCRLATNTVEYLGQARLVGPDGDELTLFAPIATHGGRLYLQTRTHILLADLAVAGG